MGREGMEPGFGVYGDEAKGPCTAPTFDHQMRPPPTKGLRTAPTRAYHPPFRQRSPALRIIISGNSTFVYQFDIATVYAEGQAVLLTRAEARALNRLRADHIQRNRSLMVKRAEQESPDGLLLRSQLDELQSNLAEYDAQYEFSDPEDEPERLGSIEQAKAQLRCEMGLGDDPVDEAGLEAEARRRLLARRKISERALQEL